MRAGVGPAIEKRPLEQAFKNLNVTRTILSISYYIPGCPSLVGFSVALVADHDFSNTIFLRSPQNEP